MAHPPDHQQHNLDLKLGEYRLPFLPTIASSLCSMLTQDTEARHYLIMWTDRDLFSIDSRSLEGTDNGDRVASLREPDDDSSHSLEATRS